MENRFGIKDFFSYLLSGVIIVMLILCLKQYDRQWDQIQELSGRVTNLTNDLTNIRTMLSNGVAVNTGNGSPTTQAVDPFGPLREAMARPDFAPGDWLVENFGTNVGKLTNLISTDVYATWVHVKVMESLAYRDPDTYKYIPMLATDWEVSEDGKTMTFNLRRGVVFSDGKPMTAKDVVFTFAWIRNPAIDAARSRAYLEKLDTVTAEGDFKVVFKWKEFVFNSFSTVVETLIMPEHFVSKYEPRVYNENPGILMGTGPYRLPTPDGWRPSSEPVTLVRNERYWGTKPAFDRLVYYQVKDDVASETMYRNREIDRFAATPEQFIKLSKDKSITDRSQPVQYFSPVSGYTFVGWNEKRGGKPTMFADKRVRRAMTMLIDRKKMAQQLYYGFAQPATGPFGYGSPQADPKIEPIPYDINAAKALLKEAGFEDRNNDGVIERVSDGVPLEFSLMYGAGNPFTDRIVLFLKDSLAQAGVKMNLDAVDWPVMLKKLDNRDFDAATLGWSTSIETDCNQIFHSKQTTDNGDNFINYISPELDAAIDKARSTVKEEQRMDAWRQVHRILHEDQPYTFLLQRQANVFIDSRIKNVRKTKMGLNVVLTELMPLPWYAPAASQLHKTQ
jgi:peptide/nickel transport system substrate-binding protein